MCAQAEQPSPDEAESDDVTRDEDAGPDNGFGYIADDEDRDFVVEEGVLPTVDEDEEPNLEDEDQVTWDKSRRRLICPYEFSEVSFVFGRLSLFDCCTGLPVLRVE